ncbi:hypothetical protein B4096_1022 [Heyndrickxia coagulans]|nr:hypothetical protein B4096_1022 [Heyndrickxia coagulans]
MVQVSFRSLQKDKKGSVRWSQCFLEVFKKTKGNKFPGKASFMVKGK